MIMAKHPVVCYHHPDQQQLVSTLISHLNCTSNIFQEQDQVITQSPGVATWIKQQIAEREGISMLRSFPPPISFLTSAYKLDSSSLARVQILQWCIFQVLPTLIESKHFSIIRKNCVEGNKINQLKLYQNSSILASLLDNYQAYRAELLSHWEKLTIGEIYALPEIEKIQALLWHTLRKKHPNLTSWKQVIENTDLSTTEELTAIHFFGLTHIPPIFIDAIHQLSEHRPIYLYWQNPVYSNEGYWEDSSSHQEWVLKSVDTHNTEPLTNPLLASFGRVGREFISTLFTGSNSNYDVHNIQIATPPHISSSLLSSIQQDIHHNRYSKLESINQKDNTFQIHSHYSIIREIEALELFLKNQFLTSPELDLSDIIILTPNIEDYVSSIDGIFGKKTLSSQPIPYRICDRKSPVDEPLIETFLKLFQLKSSQFCAAELIVFLEEPSFSTQFKLTADSLSRLTQFIRNTGIVWGKDKSHAQQQSEVIYHPYHTWKHGIQRLLLGYIMESSHESPSLWDDSLATPDVRESDFSTINALVEFIDILNHISELLLEARPLQGWLELCRKWLKLYFSQLSKYQYAWQKLNSAIEQLELQQVEQSISEPITVELFHHLLYEQLSSRSSTPGFLSGNLTFCELKPMRSIPHKVICVLGLNYGHFPRQVKRLPFDLLQHSRAVGDSSARDDDQFSFLESILSAQETLYLSYIGRDPTSNKVQEPASPLQLLINRYPLLKKCITQHPLHKHDASYFEPNSPLSDNKTDLEIAKISLANRSSIINAPEKLHHNKIELNFTVNDFIKCWLNFPKFQLTNQLQARIPWEEVPLQSNEKIELDALDSYFINNIIEQNTIGSKENLYLQLLQSNLIPYGPNGQILFSKIYAAYTKQKELLHQKKLLNIKIKLNSITIQGTLSPTLHDFNLLQITSYNEHLSEKLKIEQYLTACILAHANQSEARIQISSIPEHIYAITPEKAINGLLAFEEIYLLSQYCYLPFLLNSLSIFLKKTEQTENLTELELQKILKDTEKVSWNKYNHPEKDRAENRLLFGESAPYNETFLKIAALLKPLKCL